MSSSSQASRFRVAKARLVPPSSPVSPHDALPRDLALEPHQPQGLPVHVLVLTSLLEAAEGPVERLLGAKEREPLPSLDDAPHLGAVVEVVHAEAGIGVL